ncbi:LLM class flavin-dependent oxidoreductase [bacterium RCC_150]
MEFGLFDSFDLGDESPGQVLESRLRLAEEAERLGLDRYHVTEHHGTPLSVCPSPNLFLTALTQRTRRMRIGTLIYVLPMYEPVRFAEELAVIDQLSGGRLDFGVGRGVSPYELEYLGVDPATSLPLYIEMLQAITHALETGRFDHKGELLRDLSVELPILPIQRPYPPLWYASSNIATAEWAGTNGVHFVGRWNNGQFIEGAKAYWEAWENRDVATALNRQDRKRPCVGFSPTLVIGESDREAHDRYFEHQSRFRDNVVLRWHDHGDHKVDAFAEPEFGLNVGNAIVGSIDSVIDQLREQMSSGLVNYLEPMVYFGNMGYKEAHRNLERYTQEVIPALRSFTPETDVSTIGALTKTG